MTERRNKLGDESSPYLIQHKDNPIWWLPWGDEAFATAAREDKPVFLSVGYATCHWCHVMEGDSFEKDDVAKILNEHYIAIKVDREERPDVDALYMDAVQAMSGRGGWPMSVIMTPDRKPFWAGTFVPRDRFKSLLMQAEKAWRDERTELENSGTQLMEHLQQTATLQGQADLSDDALAGFLSDAASTFDTRYGGFGPRPKFPPSMALRVLLRIHRRSGSDQALQMVTKTLDAMARGGMYDHLCGGFHRYSVDEQWFAPHFEKMLYDNALIPMAYLEAWQLTRNPEYERVVRETLDYVERDLLLEDGALACAEDADSEKTEGKFYTWREDELAELVSDEELRAVRHAYQTENGGNFEPEAHAAELERAAGMGELEQANILYVKREEPLPDISKDPLKSALSKMKARRNQRVRPLRDDKVLTGWNGLMIGTFATAARVLDEPKYVTLAENIGEFLWRTMWRDGLLLRRYRKQVAGISATLEDYSYLIQGYLQLHQTTFEPKWLERSQALQEQQDKQFFDAPTGTYFDFDGQDKTVAVRGRTLQDNAIPSGNHVAALNNLMLGKLTANLEQINIAKKIIGHSMDGLRRYPRAFPYAAIVLDMLQDLSPEIAVAGELNEKLRTNIREMQKVFQPNAIFAAGEQSPLLVGRPAEGEVSIYVCRNQTCDKPVTNFAAAQASLCEYQSLSV